LDVEEKQHAMALWEKRWAKFVEEVASTGTDLNGTEEAL